MKKSKVFIYCGSGAVITALFIAWVIFYVEPFLSRSCPIDADILVVESWVSTRYMPKAAQEISNGNYSHIFVVGDNLSTMSDEKLSGGRGVKKALIDLGIESDIITEVSTPKKKWHKTWSQALTFRDYMVRLNYPINSVNVFTMGIHARKSQLIYQKALGIEIPVGVITAIHYSRKVRPWWSWPGGIYGVFKNSIAYLDALFFTGWGDKGITGSEYYKAASNY